jgi:light-harvesting complex 1 alpha chain
MWRLWLIFNPFRVLSVLAVFLFTLALFIHYLVLSTERFDWIEPNPPGAIAAPGNPALPPAWR